ncbi:gamma-glutamylcyclotransferase family protein [Alkalicoccus halolimnae]|uniref:Gamma-glutamylcyclotransferase n=1 Tax=Alkalicoccus halolimnae TaxID=1667239 RepID=A0A5C7FIP7_9BACI|nr:gamma-glutamylcyclotransferase family protein [Alkalicoccus halolimnae]TXF87197.1 gamma-glutamylcyclotransferase [Alkalicoccus halolimnae]
MKVFVYGTLREGCSNSFLLENSRKISSQAYLEGRLDDTGNGYPGLVEDPSEVCCGELYEINEETLRKLDDLEGYREGRRENLYERTVRSVKTADGKEEAYAYIYNYPSQTKGPIPFNDWKVHELLQEDSMLIPYFAYGSCMDTKRLEKAGVLQDFNNWAAGVLNGYKLTYSLLRSDGGRADIEESEELTEGILYFVPHRSINYLFKREGVHKKIYRPVAVEVKTDDGIFSALTFTVINKQHSTSPPSHYAEEILRGCRRGLTPEYVKKVTSQLEKLSQMTHPEERY